MVLSSFLWGVYGSIVKCSVGLRVNCDCTTVWFLKRVLQTCCLTPLWWVSKWWEKGCDRLQTNMTSTFCLYATKYEWGSKYHGTKAILISLLTYPGPWHKHLEWSPHVTLWSALTLIWIQTVQHLSERDKACCVQFRTKSWIWCKKVQALWIFCLYQMVLISN